MSNYTKITDFAIKDTYLSGNPSKLGKGTEVDNELNAISTAIASKADSASLGVASTEGRSVTSSGTAPNFTVTTNPAYGAYVASERIRVKFHADGTTGSNTLNRDGLGAKNLKQYTLAGAKVSAVVFANQLADVEYDGTDMVIINPLITNSLPICRVATTTNITLAGGAPTTYDGVSLAANDRILVAGQSTASQNGIYIVATLGTGSNGTWTRATDMDISAEAIPGMLISISEGTAGADSIWMLTTDAPITLGSTSLTFERKDGAANLIIQLTGNTTLTVATHANNSLVINSASDTTQTLPNAPPNNTVMKFHNVGNGFATIQRSGSDTLLVRGLASNTFAYVAKGDSLWIIYSGGVWYEIGGGVSGWRLFAGASLPAAASVTIPSIPRGVKKVKVLLSGVSTNGTTGPAVQLGNSSGINTSGYNVDASTLTTAVTSLRSTTQFEFGINTAASTADVVLEFTVYDELGGFTWYAIGMAARSDATALHICSGKIQLSGTNPLTQLMIKTADGTSSFDAGSYSVWIQ